MKVRKINLVGAPVTRSNNSLTENPLVRLCLDAAREPLQQNAARKIQRLMRRRDVVLRLPVPEPATPPAINRRLTPALRQALVQAYREGASLRTVANRFLVSKSAVCEAVQALDPGAMRPHSVRGAHRSPSVTETRSRKSA